MIDLEAKEIFLKDAVEKSDRQGRLNHRRLDALSHLAEFYVEQGRLREAEPLWVRVLSLKERIFGPEHQKLAAPMVELSRHYETMGRWAEAQSVLQLALRIHQRDAVENGPCVAEDLMALGRMAGHLGRWEEAEAALSRARKITRIVHGENSPAMAFCWMAEGRLAMEAHRPENARGHFLKAKQLFRELHGDLHGTVGDVLVSLAHLEKRAGNFRDAERLYRKAMDIHLRREGPRGASVAEDLIFLGELPSWRPSRAFSFLESAMKILLPSVGPWHPHVARVWVARGVSQGMLRRFEEAELSFLKAWEIFEKSLGPDAPDLWRVQNDLAALYLDRGCYAQADGLFGQLVDCHERLYGGDHPATQAALTNALVSLEVQDRLEEAEQLRRRLSAISLPTLRGGTP